MKHVLTALASLALAACTSEPIVGPSEAEPLRVTQVDGMAPTHVVGGVLLAGQPSEGALVELADRGTVLVIDLRLPGEDRGFDEGAYVRALGMAYANPAFREPEQLTDEVLDEVRRLLNDHAGHSVLLHCASANRVGAVWLAARVMDQDVPWATALEEARRVGLRSEEYEARVRAYALDPIADRWHTLKTEIRTKYPDVEPISVDVLAVRVRKTATHRPVLLDVRSEDEYAVSHLRDAQRAETLDQALAVLGGRTARPRGGRLLLGRLPLGDPGRGPDGRGLHRRPQPRGLDLRVGQHGPRGRPRRPARAGGAPLRRGLGRAPAP